MKKLMIALGLCSLLAGCTTTDISKTLRYADKRKVDTKNIPLKDLADMKRGEACTVNLLFVLPIVGDGSVLTAANEGNINDVELIGETGAWFFPFTKNCTVVYGDRLGVTSSATTEVETPYAKRGNGSDANAGDGGFWR